MKLDELVNQYFERLSENDLMIWRYISSHRALCESMTINQLASACNVSRTTVLRFAQKLSLKGYSELKAYLRLDNQNTEQTNSNIDLVCSVYEDLIKKMREKDFSSICQLIDEAENIFVYDTGMIQSSVKKEMKRIFLSAGKLLYDIRGQDELKAIVNAVTHRDLVFVLSMSGRYDFLMDFVQALRIKNVPIISITELKETPLARISTHNLYITTARIQEPAHQLEYNTCTSYFILVELLFFKYLEYKKKRGDQKDAAGKSGPGKLQLSQ